VPGRKIFQQKLHHLSNIQFFHHYFFLTISLLSLFINVMILM
jgi:hypothetical protein